MYQGETKVNRWGCPAGKLLLEITGLEVWGAIPKPVNCFYTRPLAFMPKVKWLFLWVDRCKVSLNFSGKFYIVMHTNARRQRWLTSTGHVWLITDVNYVNCFFCFTFLLDDNGARSSEFCLVFLILHKVGLFCSNNELAALKQKRESGVGFTQWNTPKFPRKSFAPWLGWNLIRLIVLHCTLSVGKYCHFKKYISAA